MSTTAVETLESLQEALDPLSALRGEQADLGSWIHDSFSALEKLHAELTQWQSELARKETELDLRQDALNKTPATGKGTNKQALQLGQELAKAKKELHQLKEQSANQRREFENLESRYDEAKLQHLIAKERVAELEGSLAVERERATADHTLWKEQFENLRGDLADYYQLLAEQVELLAATHNSHTPLSAGAAHAKSAELRRRAQSRREAQGRTR